MEEKKTVDTILKKFKTWIEEGRPIPPAEWLNKSAELNILSEELDDCIVDAKCIIADKKAELVGKGDSIAKAKALAETGDLWRNLLKLEAKRTRVQEHIRIAKLRTKEDTWGGL